MLSNHTKLVKVLATLTFVIIGSLAVAPPPSSAAGPCNPNVSDCR